MSKVKISVDPARIRKATSLLKRIKKNAERRNSKFEYEISELQFKDVGVAYYISRIDGPNGFPKPKRKINQTRNHRVQWSDEARDKIAKANKELQEAMEYYTRNRAKFGR